MKDGLSDTCRFKPGPNVHAQVLGSEVVLLDFARGDYFSLNEIGAEVWTHLAAGASLAEMATALTARYDVSVGTALDDVRAIVRELLQRSLVVSR